MVNKFEKTFGRYAPFNSYVHSVQGEGVGAGEICQLHLTDSFDHSLCLSHWQPCTHGT